MIPTQIIPQITLLEDDGDITIRVGEAKWASELGQAIIKMVTTMGVGKKVLIITPTDTRGFRLSPTVSADTVLRKQQEDAAAIAIPGNEAAENPIQALRPSQKISQDFTAPLSPELVAELKAQEEAERELEAQQRELSQDAAPVGEDEDEKVPAPRKRGRPKITELKPLQDCGRCGGAGALEGGGACPVCRGKGQLAKYK